MFPCITRCADDVLACIKSQDGLRVLYMISGFGEVIIVLEYLCHITRPGDENIPMPPEEYFHGPPFCQWFFKILVIELCLIDFFKQRYKGIVEWDSRDILGEMCWG